MLVICGTIPEKYYITHSNLTEVSNGRHRYRDKVTLSCDTGYVLSTGRPHHTIQCQSDGAWGPEDAVPHCQQGTITIKPDSPGQG